MDKVVDHLLVFNGEGRIQDFPGNYTQYREWLKLQPKPENQSSTKTEPRQRPRKTEEKRRLSYNERREYEQLGKEIDALEEEKQAIISALSGASLSVNEITEKSKRLPELEAELDEKSMRWLELSELA